MRFNIRSVDYATNDIYDQTPIGGELIMDIGNDTWIGLLDKPLKYHDERTHSDYTITHITLGARWEKTFIQPQNNLPINIALVLDINTMAQIFIAIGLADVVYK